MSNARVAIAATMVALVSASMLLTGCSAGAQSYGALRYALDGTFTPQLYASADARATSKSKSACM